MNFKSIVYLCLFPSIALSPVIADEVGGIDSGGHKVSIGTQTNHGSIGSIIATGTVDAGVVNINSGLIEVLYADPFNPDKDGNGLPDSWEDENFETVPVDPQADPDGDGTSNLMEYLADTDPNDATSNFKPEGSHDGSILTIPIKTVQGRNYEVWATNNMKDWYLDETYTGDDTLKVFNFDETTIASDHPLYSPTHPSKYFFRVKIIIP